MGSDPLEKLADAAARAVDKHADAWVDKALDEAEKLVGRSPEVAAFASPALIRLRAHKADLAAFGRWGAVTALAAFATKRTEPEMLQWLRAAANFQERLDAQAAADEALAQAAAARIAAWQRMRDTLTDVGRVAVRAAIPFIVAGIKGALDD